MRPLAIISLVCAFLAGCAASPQGGEHPAVLTQQASNALVLQAAMQRMLGRAVTLAPDALMRESTLLVEPVGVMANGQRIDGREARPPERFTLLRSEGECVLVRASTGERLVLHGADCRPL